MEVLSLFLSSCSLFLPSFFPSFLFFLFSSFLPLPIFLSSPLSSISLPPFFLPTFLPSFLFYLFLSSLSSSRNREILGAQMVLRKCFLILLDLIGDNLSADRG
jgi:hypothetical protein